MDSKFRVEIVECIMVRSKTMCETIDHVFSFVGRLFEHFCQTRLTVGRLNFLFKKTFSCSFKILSSN